MQHTIEECSLLKKQQEEKAPKLEANCSAIDIDAESDGLWILWSVVWMFMAFFSTVLFLLGVTLDPHSIPLLFDHLLFSTKLRKGKPDYHP